MTTKARRRKATEPLAPPKMIAISLPEDYARDMASGMRLNGRAAEADAIVSMVDRGGEIRVEMPVGQALEVAMSLHRTQRHAAAEECYRKALRAEPEHARGRHFFGVLLHQTKRSDEGLRHVRRSLATLAGEAWAWNNLGNIEKERGDRKAAADAYRKALAIDPDFAEAHCNLGVVLRDASHWEEADASYARAIELNPNYSEAWYNRGKLMYARGRVAEAIELLSKSMVLSMRMNSEARPMLARAHISIGEIDKAAEIYRAWAAEEPDNPTPRHLLVACTGENVPDRADDVYVATTFDKFADSFEEKLANLKYRAPEIVAQALDAALPRGVVLDTICDAGCGTGLCGPFLRPRARRLVGVDLSGGMLEKAKPRGQYDELVEAELTSFLAARPAAFDAIVSADTLCYFGALEEFARAAHAALRRSGVLVFTVEALTSPTDPDYRLQPHGRYAHARPYVEASLREAGFLVDPLGGEILRNESGRPVEGFIVTARRMA